MIKPFLSVILPIYKNQETLQELYFQIKYVCQKHNYSYEILFVDDASPDHSHSLIQQLQEKDPYVLSYSFTQNVGQHQAVLKGLEMSRGSRVVFMDADLQDPPEIIPLLLAKLEEGYDAVFAGRRGRYESFFRLLTSKIFKLILHFLCHIPKDAGMFVAVNAKMKKALETISMPSPFVVAMIGLTGLKTCSVPFFRKKRKAGKTAYTSWMRIRIALQTFYQIMQIKRAKQNPEIQKKYYAKADHFSIYPERYPTHTAKQIKKVLDFLPLNEQHKILEIGCGMGRFTIPFAKKNLNIEGLDIARPLLEKMGKFMPSIPTYCEDVLSLSPEWKKGEYDVILGFFILHHLPNLEKTFALLSSWLKPGGRILFIEPNPYNPLYYLQILLHPKMRWKNERNMIQMREKKLRNAMQDFSYFAMDRFGFFPPFLHQKFGTLEERMEKISFLHPILPYQIFYGKKSS